MKTEEQLDVIIIGGSYAGLSAAMSLGRAMRKTLVVDAGKPCNRQTPHAHNFITHDGEKPAEIAAKAMEQVLQYDTVTFKNDVVISALQTETGFSLELGLGERLYTRKLILTTGITDIMPEITGFSDCWGISILHCPYCHGYEVRGKHTGIFGNGDMGYELVKLISNWTNSLTLFTDGASTLTKEQTEKLSERGVQIVEEALAGVEHTNGYVNKIVLKGGATHPIEAIYAKPAFRQSPVVDMLGCDLNEQGFIATDMFKKTNIPGLFAAGDSATWARSLSVAIADGGMAGVMASRELIDEEF